MILCKSRKNAERTLRHIIPFLTKKLYLKVNLEKTTVSHVSKVKYLGYGFYRNKGKYRIRVHRWSNPEREEKLRRYTTGWIN